MSNYRFIISGGGTGGHIYPAIAIANELKARFPKAGFLFVGANGKMEMEKVPQEGYQIIGLNIAGLQRKPTLKNLLFPFKLIGSLLKANSIVKTFKPNLVIGTGGYASGPVMKAASAKGITCVIQEQNSYPGITNKLLAKKVAKIFTAYDGLEAFFPSEKIIKTGNPVRQDLLEIASKKPEAIQHFGFNPKKTTVLVLGGSLGARRINQLVEKELPFFESLGIQLIWQCGKLYFNEYNKYDGENVKVFQFLNRMDLAYAAADVTISRAGAGSVSELCIVGKPVIFIPSPNVAEDHQTKNAKAVVDKNAALLLKESELDSMFENVFKTLFDSDEKREQLGVNIKKLALPNATKHIIDEIEKLLK